MKILVTGSAGFIASKVCELLVSQGHTVVGIDNLNDAYDPRLKEWRLNQINSNKNFEFKKVDIVDRRELHPLFQGHRFDAVFNLAARAGVRQSVENPWVYVETNVTGTLNLLELCREFSVPKLILASTSSLYGGHNPTPFSENADTNRPLSPYAASKKGAEALCAAYAHLYKIDTPILRYFTVYGPAGRPDMSVFRFIRWIAEGETMTLYGDGSQERDFTFIDDIALGTISALQIKGFEIINLGGDKPARLKTLIGLVEKFLNKKAVIQNKPFHVADVKATWANIEKARQKLGWEPKTSFEEGIKKSVEWYLENRAWALSINLGDI